MTEGSKEVSSLNILNVQSTLVIRSSIICEFAYSQEFICKPQTNMCDAFVAICRHIQGGKKNLSCLMYMFPAEVESNDYPAFLFHF